MKKIILAALAVSALAGTMAGCAYSGVGMPSPDKVVITRNDGFLFGILRKVYVCKVADSGVTACNESESP
jgi:hypothetical protein